MTRHPTSNPDAPTSYIHSLIPHQNIVLVTDWITKIGGGEKVVEAFHRIYPDAPIYTSYCNNHWRERLDGKVVTGYLQHWPFSALRRFLPVLRQHWFSHLDLSDYDIIISITGNGEAKFVRPDYISLKKRLLRLLRLSPSTSLYLHPTSTPHTPLHISYCHTPVHFYWAQYDEYVKNPSMSPKWLARLGLKLLVKPLRKRDFAAAQKINAFIANSSAIQKDIATYYKRESTVINPPINTDDFVHISTRAEISISKRPQCIWWGRVVPAKRLDIAVTACSELGWPLTIIGDGPDLARLQSLAGPTVHFLGYIPDEERNNYIAKADLFLFPSKEDFGVAPVEALAAGLPVLAYREGGALDYIVEGENGAFFSNQTAASLIKSLISIVGLVYDTQVISESVNRFSSVSFQKKIRTFVHENTNITKRHSD
ncbi:glycosyltransferase family 4 protein [Candidatus Saccharibacteria bacterium]|nr:glycosyltransferase family 4 protein [Candidatus Saccharibacteria bacterium]